MADRHIDLRSYQVRAAFDGRLSQTRRVLKPLKREGPGYVMWPVYARKDEGMRRCGSSTQPDRAAPYAVGDKLWVREAHAMLPRLAYRGSIGTGTIAQIEHPTDGYSAAVFREGFDRSGPPKWRPSIHMPRWASRLTLVVTDVRVQRLRQISREDAIAEGLVQIEHVSAAAVEMGCNWGFEGDSRHGCPVSAYAALWNSIHGPGAWDANPWVCAVSFTVHHCNIDAMEHQP